MRRALRIGRGWRAAAAALLIVLLAACSTGARGNAPPAPVVSRQALCGTSAAAPQIEHVVWIIFENKSYDQILGEKSEAPYMRYLARHCGSAKAMFAETHPSLPNYIALTSGSTHGVKDDRGPDANSISADSIFSQLGPGRWNAWQESMPANCTRSDDGHYAVRHNPPVYFTAVNDECQGQDTPIPSDLNLTADLTVVTPNMKNDMHDGSIGEGDRWLGAFLPKLTATTQYQQGRTAVFVTFDEDDGSQNNQIATIVISPTTPAGAAPTERFTHYSILRTTEEILNLPLLGEATAARSMRDAFNL